MTINLRAERLNRGLTIQALSDLTDVSKPVLTRAESGVTVPSPENAKKIADFYGVLVTDIWPVERPGVAA